MWNLADIYGRNPQDIDMCISATTVMAPKIEKDDMGDDVVTWKVRLHFYAPPHEQLPLMLTGAVGRRSSPTCCTL